MMDILINIALVYMLILTLVLSTITVISICLDIRIKK